MTEQSVTGMYDGFVEVVNDNTGNVERVPREWLDDPRLGRFIQRTNAQLALDHALPPLPADAKLAELRDYATSAGLDVEGASTKADFQALLEPVTAVPGEDPNPSDNDDNPPAAGDN
jgi:hypothetical protein